MRLCTCGSACVHDLLAAWDRRAEPILARLLEHGHPLDFPRILRVKALTRGLSRGDAQALAPEHTGLSHHLPGCPRKGNRDAR